MSLLGGVNVKCKVCTKTAYPQESIQYDQQTYHKRCFRCTKCENTVSIGAVAMIQGDLYCKPCFLKLFKLKGTYHVFGNKTLPASMRDDADNSAGIKEAHTRTMSSGAPVAADEKVDVAAIAAVCVLDTCDKPREAGKTMCAEHWEAHQKKLQEQPPAVAALIQAVKAKKLADVISTLEQNGPLAALTVDASTQKSPLEFAFSADGSNACAESMLTAVIAKLKSLEEQRSALQKQLASRPESTMVLDDAKDTTGVAAAVTIPSVAPADTAAPAAQPEPEPAAAATVAPVEVEPSAS